MKILIVEDDLISRKLLEKTIRGWGNEVMTAENGQEAWDIFQKESIKFIIADWMMPVMDGLALCKKIRALDNTGYIYFILLTSKDKKDDVVQGLDAGADDYVSKPYDFEELKVRIRVGERILKLEKELTQNNKTLSRVNEQLEHAIVERKKTEEEKERMRGQWAQAQKMEAIGTLAGGIAHDFNNILGAILGFANMAKEEVPAESQVHDDLDHILKAGHRAKDLVQQLLAFSHQTSVNLMPINIQPLVKNLLNMLRASLPTTIDIKEDISSHKGCILADSTMIHQIVMDLCTNAFYAMRKTGGVLSVKLKAISSDSLLPLVKSQGIIPGEYVKLTIGDTGTGIGPDIIDKIFDPYFTTKEIGKGTGMSLSIAHGIIKSYGGAITVDSTLGQGTTFHVYLPVIQEEVKELEESKEAPRGKGRDTIGQ